MASIEVQCDHCGYLIKPSKRSGPCPKCGSEEVTVTNLEEEDREPYPIDCWREF